MCTAVEHHAVLSAVEQAEHHRVVPVLPDGSVGDVKAMRGEEPFVSAAIAAVKKWKYEPARLNGQAITVYRIVQIPFKLTA